MISVREVKFKGNMCLLQWDCGVKLVCTYHTGHPNGGQSTGLLSVKVPVKLTLSVIV